MLSVSKAIKSAGQGEYYLSLAATDDYYLGDGGEPPGFWLGRGAEALGLRGTLDADDFRHLLRGRSPDGQQKIVHNADSANRRAGWDLTWSVPKSVSVAWSQADPLTRAQIEACLRRAVHAGVGYLESLGVVSGAAKTAWAEAPGSSSPASSTRPVEHKILNSTSTPFCSTLEFGPMVRPALWSRARFTATNSPPAPSFGRTGRAIGRAAELSRPPSRALL
jgi:hypothetical protein